MEIYYENSLGKRIYFDRKPYRMLLDTTLFDYSWKYSTSGMNKLRVSSFQKQMTTPQISVVISASTIEEGSRYKEEMLGILDADIMLKTPGKFYVGDCYLRCYFIGSTKERYVKRLSAKATFDILAENGNWICEKAVSFSKITSDAYVADGLDYTHEYPYDYANSLASRRIINDNYAASDFEMTIYGSCQNPEISIGTHTYSVSAKLITGEYMVINSSTKKIYKVKNNGERVNLYHCQGREFYIFEKIPSGTLAVAWTGGFGFDIKLLQERSEPKWT